MTWDSKRSRLVLFGGLSLNQRFNDTWDWDGSAWAERQTDGAPAQRQGVGLAFDSNRNVLTVFGGQPRPNEVWELNEALVWSKRENVVVAPIPSRLAGFAMAYDPIHRLYVGFGGHSESNALSATILWDGVAAARQPDLSPSPPGVRGTNMVWDPFRERIVLFGGLLARNSRHTSEMWLFDGASTSWQRDAVASALASDATTGPGQRSPGCMAYDKARRLLVVVGGRSESESALADTWLWDGTKWFLGPSGPSARRTCALGFDEVNRSIVLFAGQPPGDSREGSDDTWILK